MKKVLKWVILLATIIATFGVFNVQIKAATTVARLIATNPGQDANNEMRINWHTDLGITGVYVMYTEKKDTEWLKAKKMEGTGVINNAFTGLNTEGTSFIQWGAVLSDLKENTEYMYKVGNNDLAMSEPYYFKTGSQSFSFCWISDFHAYYEDARRLNAATGVMNEAIAINGGVDFIFSTGDTIAHGGTYKWWEQVANAPWMKNYMYVDTIGNHDYMTKVGTYKSDGAGNAFFQATHNYPRNGYMDSQYGDQNNACYYYYYGDALFVVLNSMECGNDQLTWSEEVLKNNDAQYKIILQHYAWFNDSGSFRTAGYSKWHELCDKYDVDVAFAGDSHVYLRTNSVYQGQPSDNPNKGTVYLNAPSSDGDRGKEMPTMTQNLDLIEKYWTGGVYQIACSVVNFDATGMNIKLINKGGTVIDEAVIPAKRGPSARYSQDLSNFDKEKFEESVTYVQSVVDSNRGYLSMSTDALKVLIKVELVDNNEVIYTHIINDENGISFAIPKEVNDLKVRLHYVDGSRVEKALSIINNTNYGEIFNLVVKRVNDRIEVTWEENLNNNVKNIQIYKDRQLVNTVETGVKYAQFDEGENFELRVIDYNSQVLYSLNRNITTLYGDINQDGVEDLEDVKMIQKYITGKLALDKLPLQLADINNDGKVNIADANLLQLYVNGKIANLEKGIYTVLFKDPLGNVIKRQTVNSGNDAVAPQFTNESNYYFIKWNQDYHNVQTDLEIIAWCEIAPTEITLIGPEETDIGVATIVNVSSSPLYSLDKLIWSSSNPNVATVNDLGEVTFITAGTVTITARAAADENIEGNWTVQCVGETVEEINATRIVYDDLTANRIIIGKRTFNFNAPVYNSVNDAIVAAAAGERIVILPGTYIGDIIIDKAVTLTSLNENVTINNKRLPEAVIQGKASISASDVTINGLQFSGASSQSGTSCYGLIYTTGGKSLNNLTIIYNNIIAAGFGSHTGIIRFGNSASGTVFTNVNVSYNAIHSNASGQSAISQRERGADQANSAVIYRTTIKNGIICNNTFTGTYFGIMNLEMGSAGSFRIIGNTITGNYTDHLLRFSTGTGTVTVKEILESEIKKGTAAVVTVVVE